MKTDRKKGILCVFFASIFWSTGGILIKFVTWHPMAIAGMRSGITALFLYFYLLKFKKNTSIKTIVSYSRNKYIGAFFFAATMITYVVANKLTTAANAILLQFSAPIWVALISHFFINIKVKRRDWFTIAVVFIGMGLFFLGDINIGNTIGNIVAILSGVTWALVAIMLRYQENSSTVEMVILGCIISFIISMPYYFTQSYSFSSIIVILSLGIFQLGMGYLLFANGASLVSPIESALIPILEPLLNPIWVFIFYGEPVSNWAIIGGFTVITSIITKSILDIRENKKYKQFEQKEKHACN